MKQEQYTITRASAAGTMGMRVSALKESLVVITITIQKERM